MKTKLREQSSFLEMLAEADNDEQEISNTLISSPLRLSKLEFKSSLIQSKLWKEKYNFIADANIQSIVIIEASRQMASAISEKFLILNDKKSFVLDDITATFLEYIFPLDIELIFTIIKIDYDLNGNFKAKADIKILQNEQTVMYSSLSFSAMEKSILLKLESELEQSYINEPIKTPNFRLVISAHKHV